MLSTNPIYGDEVVQWTLSATGTAIEATAGPLLKPNEMYKLVLVPGHLPQDATHATISGHLGKASPNERTELSFSMSGCVKPLHTYHVAYCEWGMWHWQTISVPIVVRLLTVTDSQCVALVDYCHHPSVVQLKATLTLHNNEKNCPSETLSDSSIIEKSFDIDELPMDADESLHKLVFRHLRTATRYFLQVRPVFAQDPEGRAVAQRLRREMGKGEEESDEDVEVLLPQQQQQQPSTTTTPSSPLRSRTIDGHALLRKETYGDPTRALWAPRDPNEPEALLFLQSRVRSLSVAHRFVTQPDVLVTVQEIGDTYLRLVLRRPLLRAPLSEGVSQDDANVAEYTVQLWEDPRTSLKQNAVRLSRGRRTQKYPLRRAEVKGHHIPCGHYETILIDKLRPNADHFVLIQTKSNEMSRMDPRCKRIYFRTRSELEITSFAVSPTSARLQWQQAPLVDLGACHMDVDFPLTVDSYSNADDVRPKPYVGPNVMELQGGQTWLPPTMLNAIANNTSRSDAASSYEIQIRDVDSGEVRLLHITNTTSMTSGGGEALIDNLRPNACLMLSVRVAAKVLLPSRSAPPSPWGRPHMFVLPSPLLSKVLTRTSDSLQVGWGTHQPAVVHRLDYLPGRQRYLPYLNVQRDQLEADAKARESLGGSSRQSTTTGPALLPGAHSKQWMHPYGFYYYLEPLPFLCGSEVEEAELSDSDEEVEVYADNDVLGSGSGFLGKQSRIVSRAPRPIALPFPALQDMHEEIKSVRVCVYQAVPTQRDTTSSSSSHRFRITEERTTSKEPSEEINDGPLLTPKRDGMWLQATRTQSQEDASVSEGRHTEDSEGPLPGIRNETTLVASEGPGSSASLLDGPSQQQRNARSQNRFRQQDNIPAGLVQCVVDDLTAAKSSLARAVEWCRTNPYQDETVSEVLSNATFALSQPLIVPNNSAPAEAAPDNNVTSSSKNILTKPPLATSTLVGEETATVAVDTTSAPAESSIQYVTLRLVQEQCHSGPQEVGGVMDLNNLPSDTQLLIAVFATTTSHKVDNDDEDEESNEVLVERLVEFYPAFTLQSTANVASTVCPTQVTANNNNNENESVDQTALLPLHAAAVNQRTWGSHLFDQLYAQERKAELSVIEVSEVYVSLHLGRMAAAYQHSHRLSLLHNGLLEWTETASDDDENDEGLEEEEESDDDLDLKKNDSGEAVKDADENIATRPIQEFLLKVEQIELVDGVRHVIGETSIVYVASQDPAYQLVNLTAASRYEVSIATIHTQTQLWTPFSAPVAFVTVQKLLLELDEISSEYVGLRWARSGRVDKHVSYFALHLLDVYESQEETRRQRALALVTAGSSYYRGGSKSFGTGLSRSRMMAVVRKTATATTAVPNSSSSGSTAILAAAKLSKSQQLSTSAAAPPPSLETLFSSKIIACGNFAKVVETIEMRHRVTLQGNHALLHHNSMYDCMVAPHYDNGERGLFSNALRFVHCTVKGRVEEVGVAHMRISWDPISFAKLMPRCTNTNNSNDGSLSSEALRQCVCIIRLRNKEGTWERTRQVKPDIACVCVFEELHPEEDHVADVSFVALVPRCNCCEMDSTREALDCAAQPFQITGRTLRRPHAWVSKVGEDAIEIEWAFESEEGHEGPVSLGVRFADTRDSSRITERVVECEAKGPLGTGQHLFQDLAPQRTYQCSIRQQYSRGTWGEWQPVFDRVPTLPGLRLTLVAASETFFQVQVHRPPLDFRAVKGMEKAVEIAPQQYRFTVTPIQPPTTAAATANGSGNGLTHATTFVMRSNSATDLHSKQHHLLNIDASSVFSPNSTLNSTAGALAEIAIVEPLITDSKEPSAALQKLQPNTPYTIIAQQWSVDDWGRPSAEVCSYTLRSMVPFVLRRCDSFIDIQCARDRRIPSVATSRCTPHSEVTSMRLSRLMGVHLSATSLISDVLSCKIFIPCTEATCASIPARMAGFDAAHPYRIDVRPQYEGDLFCPLLTSLATITIPLPTVTVSTLAEDFVCLTLDKNKVPAAMTQAQEAFQGLPHVVRHAANEGSIVEVSAFEFLFEGLLFDEYENAADRPRTFLSGKDKEDVTIDAKSVAVVKDGLVHDMRYTVSLVTHTADVRGKAHLVGTFETRPFPNIAVNKLAENFAEFTWEPKVNVASPLDAEDEDRAATTVGGSIQKKFGQAMRIEPAAMYNMKDNGNQGDMYEFVLLENRILSENAQDNKNSKLLVNGSVPTLESSQRRKSSTNSNNMATLDEKVQSPASVLPPKQTFHRQDDDEEGDEEQDAEDNERQKNGSPLQADGGEEDDDDLEDSSNFDIVRYIAESSRTRRKAVSYESLCALVESLIPETAYVVFGRVTRTVTASDGSTHRVASAWGPPTVFSTLALLVLRIVHCSLDFVNVAWQDPSNLTSPTQRLVDANAQGTVARLPLMLWDSSLAFTKEVKEDAHALGSNTGSAQPVRFQMRCMHATPDGGCGEVLEDMYVTTTEDGIHTVSHLTPGTAYALSMRVCYETLTGSWVAPAAFRTDAFPEPKILSVTRNDAELLLDLHPGVELRGDEDKAVPIRTNRLYEIMINDDETNIKSLLVSTLQPYRLYLPGLKRGSRYRVAIREVIAGEVYGSFCHLSAFWVQPYPPVMVRLLECRDGFCHMEWAVIERKSKVAQEKEDDVEYVYQLEQGIRLFQSENETTPSSALITSAEMKQQSRSATQVIEGMLWKEVVTTDVPQHRFRWFDNLPSDRSVQNTQFNQLCFRVRASKCFVKQDDSVAYKTPVWGDWSLVAAWDNAVPPTSVQKLKLTYCGDITAQVQWEPPEGHEVHPQLSYSIRISFDATPNASEDGADSAETLEDAVGSTTRTAGSGGISAGGWYLCGNTSNLNYEITGLAKATAYRIAVTAESSFGVSKRASRISFVTRSIPNPDPIGPPSVIKKQTLSANSTMNSTGGGGALSTTVLSRGPSHKTNNVYLNTYMDPVHYKLLPGLRPIDANAKHATNLFDKYEQPKKLRRRALARMAGLYDKTEHQRNIRHQFQGTIRRIIFIQRVISADAVLYMQRPKFKPNEPYTPEQVARLRFGQEAEASAVIWTREVEEYFQEELQMYRTGETSFSASPLRWLGPESMFDERAVTAVAAVRGSRPNSVRSHLSSSVRSGSTKTAGASFGRSAPLKPLRTEAKPTANIPREDEDDVSWSVPAPRTASGGNHNNSSKQPLSASATFPSNRRLAPLPVRRANTQNFSKPHHKGNNNNNNESGSNKTTLPSLGQNNELQDTNVSFQHVITLTTSTGGGGVDDQPIDSPLFLSPTSTNNNHFSPKTAAPVASLVSNLFVDKSHHHNPPHPKQLPRLPLTQSQGLLLGAPGSPKGSHGALKSPHRQKSPNTQTAPSSFSPHLIARQQQLQLQQQQQQPLLTPHHNSAKGVATAVTAAVVMHRAEAAATTKNNAVEAIAVVDPPPLLPSLLRQRFEKK